jgi:hypothetical protein
LNFVLNINLRLLKDEFIDIPEVVNNLHANTLYWRELAEELQLKEFQKKHQYLHDAKYSEARANSIQEHNENFEDEEQLDLELEEDEIYDNLESTQNPPQNDK